MARTDERSRAKVSTIAPDLPFVDALAAGLLARLGREPLALARATLFLPTRRAGLALRDAFLRLGAGEALLLPRIVPLGDIAPDDEDAGEDGEIPFVADEALPPAIPELERRLLLTRLVLARAESDGGSAQVDQAARLAGELARLLDQAQGERLSFDGLAELVPEDYAAHWRKTLEFLKIVTAHWPAILAERGLIDPVARRNLAAQALLARWRDAPPTHPVIAAGSTGSVPATADLLAAIARLPAGEVVLPGLDRAADEASWAAIDASHPQYGLKRLLAHIGIDRDQVTDWETGDAPVPEPGEAARVALLATALLPAETTDAWRDAPPAPEAAFAGLARIDCPDPEAEARVIALRMRATLETPGKTAALITRDRTLARRVAATLRRWGIEVDDSGGRPLANTAPGSFLRLTAALVAERAAPLALLAALKHPLAAGGEAPGRFRARARALEVAVLRGPRPEAGFAGLDAALAAVEVSKGLRDWLARLGHAAADFEAATAAREIAFDRILRAHLGFAEWLAASDADDGAARLWRGDAGEAAAAFFAELLDGAGALPAIAGTRYPALLDALMDGRVARPRFGAHARLHIWGPLEARLQHADVMILGGLNEGSWPPEPLVDAWLSRPMRERFGLPAPERRIGLAAHDFVQCAAAREVLLTRSEKVAGAPTVPARWLARLAHLLAGWERGDKLAPAEPWLAWQDALDRPAEDERIEPRPPAPRPPVSARPRRLSVTAIETWRRDPYAIYARRILRLRPLDPIDASPDAAARGTFIHAALDAFVRDWPDALPDDAYERLLEHGRAAFRGAIDRPGVRAFWWPRFERIARWFVEKESERRAAIVDLRSELSGRLVLGDEDRAFTLTAKADRIERDAEGRLAIIDYKTGSPPSKGDIEAGLACQLPLEAAIAAAGGFEGLPAGPVAALAHWRLTGGDPAGEILPVKLDPGEAAAAARAGLERLIAAFDDPATPYHACPDFANRPRFNDYAHLERLAEWADIDEEETS